MTDFDAKACHVIRHSNWFFQNEYESKTAEQKEGSIFDGQNAHKPQEIGCEVTITNELPMQVCKKKPKDAPEVNRHIEDFRQGLGTGTCWILASLKSLAMSEGGDKIIKNMINQDKCGNVIIKFPGARESLKEINLSKDEINNTYSLASLDADAKVIEMGIRKYRKLALMEDLKKENADYDKIKYDLVQGDGGNPVEALELMTGKIAHETTPFYETATYLGKGEMYDVETVKKNFADVHTKPTVLSITNPAVLGDRLTVKVGGVDLNYNHAYSVLGVKDDKLQIRNPHRTATEIEIPIKDFIEFIKNDDNVKAHIAQID